MLDPASARLAAAYFGVSAAGEVGGRSVLHVAEPVAAVAAREGVDEAAARAWIESRRASSSWRRAIAGPRRRSITRWSWRGTGSPSRRWRARRAPLAEPRYAEQAARAADVILGAAHDGRLPRSLVDGVAGGRGYLEDYAFLIAGLLDLFEATGDPR